MISNFQRSSCNCSYLWTVCNIFCCFVRLLFWNHFILLSFVFKDTRRLNAQSWETVRGEKYRAFVSLIFLSIFYLLYLIFSPLHLGEIVWNTGARRWLQSYFCHCRHFLNFLVLNKLLNSSGSQFPHLRVDVIGLNDGQISELSEPCFSSMEV